MSEESKIITAEADQKTRRGFVKTSAQVAVTAPAVALLLNAAAKADGCDPNPNPYQAALCRILDDFTFGNNEEDIDAIAIGSNFIPWNGSVALDDQIPS